MQPQTQAQPKVISIKEHEVIISIPRFLFERDKEGGAAMEQGDVATARTTREENVLEGAGARGWF